MTVLDVSGQLSESDHFFHDDHVRASGHAKIAGLLMHEIEANEAAQRSGRPQEQRRRWCCIPATDG